MLALVVGLAACHASSTAEPPVVVAVAANMAAAHRELARRFTERSGVRVQSSIGATGQLYAQILNGAPFEVFVAADAEHPAALGRVGAAVDSTRRTYALGRLVLYAPGSAPLPDAPWPRLVNRGVRLALANPRTAPYGAAALDALRALGLDSGSAFVWVRGASVGHAFQFVRSGAAEAGLVALSQVIDEPVDSYWLVPESLYAPLRQQVVVLAPGAGHGAAHEFAAFLVSPEARLILRRYGYGAADVDRSPTPRAPPDAAARVPASARDDD